MSMRRANLLISRQVDATGPDGTKWTVLMQRVGTPRIPHFNVNGFSGRLFVNWIRNYRRWEVIASSGDAVRRWGPFTRSVALEQAIAVAEALDAGRSPE